MAPAPTSEKVRGLLEFLAAYKAQGCSFSLSPRPSLEGQPLRQLYVVAHLPDGSWPADLSILLPEKPSLNLKQAVAVMQAWDAADVEKRPLQ